MMNGKGWREGREISEGRKERESKGREEKERRGRREEATSKCS